MFTEFWATQESNIDSIFSNIDLSGFDDEERDFEKQDIAKAKEREKDFAKSIIAKFVEWSAQPNVLVYWDLDDTVGQYRRVKQNYVFLNRPIFVPLLTFLQEHFPTITHGILTDRKTDEINRSLESGGHLFPLNSAFLIKNSFIVHGVHQMNLPRKQKRLTPPYLKKVFVKTKLIQKMNIMTEVKKRHPELNIKLIDDLPDMKKALGANGLSVTKFIPRKIIDIIHKKDK